MTPEQAAAALDSTVTVALLVATDATAPATAWSLARHLAPDRPTALIDLTLGEGALDATADATGPEGIVDVFEFGASWSHVARPQHTPGLHFVPDGTPTADPHAIWGHARWEKLKRGFVQQGALLILYVPPKALADLAPRADAMVALGSGPSLATVRTLAAGRGLPLLGPIAGRQPEPDKASPEAPPPPTPSRTTARWVPWAVGAGAALAVFAVAFELLQPRASDPTATPTPPPVAAATMAPEPTPPPDEPAPTAASAPATDTLFYAVQVAAFNQLGQARDAAGTLEAAGHVVAIAPVRIGSRQVLWYRVLVGALETPSEAATTRAALWRAGLLQRGQGTVLRVPHAWALDADGTGGSSERLAGLRQRGIPAYIVSGAGGSALLLGAFETPEQAAAAESLLAAAGRPHTLVDRRGTR
ncbi:MAG: SPOR domain-containing protein [Gemmatimonadales bacterium]